MVPNAGCVYAPLLCSDEAASKFDKHGFLELTFFTWLNPFLALGRKKVLDPADIPPLASKDRTNTAFSKFVFEWNSQNNPTILCTLAKCHWKDVFMTGTFALFKTLTASCIPLFLKYFIGFSAADHDKDNFGYVLVGMLFVFKVIENLSQRHWSIGGRRMGIRVRNSLIIAIYEKEMKLTQEARQRHSTGEIAGYISVDTFRLSEFAWWLHQAWTSPLQIVLPFVIVVTTVGWATLPGVLVVVLAGLTQLPVGWAQQNSQSKFMMAQDERLHATASVLSNMKIVKLQAWEDVFQGRVKSLRDSEFKWLSYLKHIKAINIFCFWMLPVLTASVVFAACIPIGLKLDATVVFTVLASLQAMAEPIYNIPEVLSAAIQANISLRRLSSYIHDTELQSETVPHLDNRVAISIENCWWTWENSLKPTLSDINLKLRPTELVAVCGEVGSGKSTLLLSILAETQRLSGRVTVQGNIAYVAQSAWIQSGTLKENIIFGHPFEENRYQETLDACCLLEDIRHFSHGDLTEIGERGLNLSGGQKQRVQLARALYSNADIYLLDDPFSALDAKTASTIFKVLKHFKGDDCCFFFQSYVLKALSSKTVILVTHQVEFLEAIKTVKVMDAGRLLNDSEKQSRRDLAFACVSREADQCLDGSKVEDRTYCQLTQDEEWGNGDLLGLQPLRYYLKTSESRHLFMLALVAQIFCFVGTASINYLMASQVSNPTVNSIILICLFSVVSTLSTGAIYWRVLLLNKMGLRASQSFFNNLMESLFLAPMAFFDVTPVGRILSRASSDLNVLDMDIPVAIMYIISGTIQALGILVIIAFVTWQVLLVAMPMVAVFAFLMRYYLATSRQLVRINGITKAPLLNKSSETMNGAVTIRAFRKQEQFKNEFIQQVDANAKAAFYTYAAYEWVALRVELTGVCILTAAALLLVLFNDIAPGLAGLSLSYALSANASLILLVEGWSNMANYIVSAERIAQYMDLPKEAPQMIKGARPATAWPDKGRIELHNLQIRYRESSPLVLKGISCIIPSGNRVGVVGRTGSGKTTLISALFRLVEFSGGRILIDGLDISSIGLLDLRSRLGVIPQEAFLFRGTVRSNLDPTGMCSDPEMWQVLQKCRLVRLIDTLDAQVNDDGENWSAGQRQLFCLARVLLKRCKVLILDEATASIDSITDGIIQTVIREEMVGCTVITVAHRIPTVLDSDIILGLNEGSLVDYGDPATLLLNPNCLFSKLVSEFTRT